jgi:hypothetical protein
VSANADGVLTERRWFGDQEVLVHYDDIPDRDITTVQGIPCTTALRTMIDLAPDIDRVQLRRAVDECLDRSLFTLDEAWARLAEPDMATRSGAAILREVLRALG